MNRGNQILAAVLAVQLALIVAVFWPRSPSAAGGEPLLAGVEAAQIVRLTIASQAVDGENVESLEMAKSEEEWVLPTMGDYPCQPGAVPELLDKIVALKGGKKVTETSESHKQLKVADQDFAHRVELVLEDGSMHMLYLGTSPSYNAIHVRVGGQDEVYLASGLSGTDVSAQPGAWIDTLYFTVPQDEIVALALENANGRFEFVKNDDGQWIMPDRLADEELDQANVTLLVSRVASVRMLRPLGKEAQIDYGMDVPQAVITLQTVGAEGTTRTYELSVGALRQEGGSVGYVFKSTESPYYVHVAEYTVQDWVEKTRDGFMVAPPTPEPAS